jgi:cytochrome b subunit of formate dehydrogenase
VRINVINQIIVLTITAFLYLSGSVSADEICFECHGDLDFIVEVDGKSVSLYVDDVGFTKSIHADIGCSGCHADTDPDDLPHEEELSPVQCSDCHDNLARQYGRSLHGQALRHGKYLAPDCTSCHGKHDILPSTDEDSRTYVMNIPSLCGTCHKEGTPVSHLETVGEQHALENYSQSIHGDGLFKRGLIVTAVCTSCHTSHNILPHEDPASTINRDNISRTCMKCHAQIENVHLKVIRGELWEKSPHEIPICIDCHQPHNVRRVFYEESFPDEMCVSCHGDEELEKIDGGEVISLYVDAEEHQKSAHGKNSCIKCHTNISNSRDPVCRSSGKVDCSICHSEQVEDYQISQHGTFNAAGNPVAPYCTDCHGVHDVQLKEDLSSPTFSRNIPDLCGRCHREGQEAAVAYTGKEHEIIKNYTMSIHGKGLIQSGLMVTATCIDCHTSHSEMPVKDPRSTVHPANIAATCAKCHLGIYEEYKYSVHSNLVTKTEKDLPVCKDCHLSHTIARVDLAAFRQGILDQCGKCHLDVAVTYFDTFHGKVSKLGSPRTAKCYDCHGAHNILPTSNPNSTLSRGNVVETCKQCHPNSNRKFVGYLTHATHHDKTKYPYLYYTFWFMTFLLIGTFSLFGVHTIMWIPKALSERHHKGKIVHDPGATFYERFDPFSRFTHLLVILSFLSLALTGMTIKFSGVGVFQTLSKAMGGYEVTGYVHRYAAVITFIYFGLHIGYLIRKKRQFRMSLKDMLTGEDTLLFRKTDLVECGQTIKWFLGLGPRPKYGKWTYWEKFDYFAVFWGITVIGSSGLLLWFSEFFTYLGFPGWFINVATIIHSDEALLATGFIFTIHFFNTHFRPEKFPMDPVIFTGRVSMEELKEDRPREYARAIKTRAIRKKLVEPEPRWLRGGAKIFGLTCLSIGIFIILLTIYSMIFLYQ